MFCCSCFSGCCFSHNQIQPVIHIPSQPVCFQSSSAIPPQNQVIAQSLPPPLTPKTFRTPTPPSETSSSYEDPSEAASPPGLDPFGPLSTPTINGLEFRWGNTKKLYPDAFPQLWV